MRTSITITKGVEVDITTVDGRDAQGWLDYARVAVIPATEYTEAREVARASIYERDRSDGSSRYTITGSFADNYAVERKARAAVGGSEAPEGVEFDSESGQFFAYARNVVVAEQLATIVVRAAVEVALERGEL